MFHRFHKRSSVQVERLGLSAILAALFVALLGRPRTCSFWSTPIIKPTAVSTTIAIPVFKFPEQPENLIGQIHLSSLVRMPCQIQSPQCLLAIPLLHLGYAFQLGLDLLQNFFVIHFLFCSFHLIWKINTNQLTRIPTYGTRCVTRYLVQVRL